MSGRHGTPFAGWTRQLGWYFGGLLATYAVGLAVFWPDSGDYPSNGLFAVLMFAPTVGAILAVLLGKGHIQFGRLSWWILAGLVPTLAVLAVYLLGGVIGWDVEDPSVLRAALLSAPVAIGSAAVTAVGEEIGWRGFLWPTLRSRWGFWQVSLVLGAIWWVYHVPLILFGWYGTLAGLPAFTVAIAGFTLFVGVLTDRSHSVWPSVLAHSAWNGMVATSFAATEDILPIPAFSGSDQLLGEFGWLAAITTFLLGVGTALWHVRRGGGAPEQALEALEVRGR